MDGDKKINVPLIWYEIDEIVIALRIVNQAITGSVRSELEEKMSNYSMQAKAENWSHNPTR